MSWPNKIYVATKTLGVYYTNNFSSPSTQPKWATVNGGLPATDVRQFALDPFAPADKQYLLLETARTLYRRDNGGNWAAILTSAEADTLTGEDSGGTLFHFGLDPSIEGRIWIEYRNNITTSAVWALYSDDYGDNWIATTKVRDSGVNWTQDLNGIFAYGDTVFACGTKEDQQFAYYSTNKGASWTLSGLNPGTSGRAQNPLQSTLIYVSSTTVKTLTDAGVLTELTAVHGFASNDGIWFAVADASHQRAIVGAKIYSTSDSWANENTPSDITPPPRSIAPWAGDDEDNMLVGLDFGAYDSGNRHIVGCLYGEDDTTAVGIAGTNCGDTPFTDSIPDTCGGLAIGGIAAVEETPSEGPTPPPGGTITPPGGTPIMLGGAANVNAVSMPGYTGTARGEPLPGDRGAFMVDTAAHAALHASDILAGAPTRHNPAPGASGTVPMSDGSKYVVADVLTPTEHTAIGDAAPHHAPVTLDASADTIMDLSGQAISLETETANTVLAGPVSGVAAAPDFRALTNADLPDPLAFKTAANALVVSAGAVTATQNLHTITSESGTSDDLTTITAAALRTLLLIYATATHTITVKHGTGNISLNGAADFILSGNKSLLLFWNGTAWVDLGAGGGGGAALTVKEIDGTPDVSTVSEIRVTNGTLTDVGSGVVQIDFGSAATDGAAIHDDVAGEIHAITNKATPVNADELVIEDSADSWNKKRVAISALPTGESADPSKIILTNSYASRPAAGTAGRIFLPNNSYYLERDNGTAWIPWGPIFPMTPPVLGNFTWVNQGEATAAVTNGGIYLYTPKSGTNVRVLKKAAPARPYTITACYLSHIMASNYLACGLVFRQSSDGKLITFGNLHNNVFYLASVKWNSPTSWSADVFKLGALTGYLMFIRIADDDTNRICSWSADGQNWIVLHTVGRTDFMTADEVGFFVHGENGTYPAALTLLSWKEA